MQYATELSLCVLAVIFPGERGLAGYIEAKDDGSGNDSWSRKSCKAPVISSQPTSNTQPFTGRMPFMLPSQQHQSTEGKISHFADLLIPRLLRVLQCCL